MNDKFKLEPCLEEAIIKFEDYMLKTTGEKSTQKELAKALSKYFVLKEIREFIEMSRMGEV